MANIFSKIFGRSRAKSYSLDQLGRILGSNSVLSTTGQLDQYRKSVYVYACVDKIAKYTATVDLTLHEIINTKGDSREVLVHPALDLLYKFNPWQTRSEFLRITMINKKLTGKAYWHKVRNDRGQVVELWNLRPDMVTIIPDPDGEIIKHYLVTFEDGSQEEVLFEDIIFLRDPDPLCIYDGVSPVQAARGRIQTEELAASYQRDFFLNAARPDGILRNNEGMTQEEAQAAKDRWNETHKGRGKNSRIAVLAGGIEYQQISLSQREMDYIESMKFTRDDILVAFGVPKSIITTDDVNRANAEAGIYMFMTQTIKPEMIQLVEVLNEFLLVPEFGEKYYLDYTDPTPEDRTLKLSEYTQGVDKWITRNEIRSQLGYEPIDGGDELFGSLINVPLGKVGEPTPTQNSIRHLSGRRRLQVELGIQEVMEKNATDEANVSKKEKKGKKARKNKKVLVSILTNKEVRQNYFLYVNKAIDAKAKRFKSALGKEMKAQEKRVKDALLKADLEKAIDKRKISTQKLDSILNAKGEDKLIAEFGLPFLTEFLKSSGQDAMDFVDDGKEFKVTEAIKAKLEKRAKFFAASINDTTFKRLASSLTEGIAAGEGITQLSDRVGDVYTQYNDYRLDLIARTESTNANNEGFQDGYKQSDVVEGKEWIATLDDRTREEHVILDGEIVGLEDNFSNGVPYPQEYNCRCVIAPVVSN